MAIKFSQCNTLYLAGAGVIVGATNVVLTSLTDIYGNVLTMSNFGTKGFITLEPDTSNEESATFTSIVANPNGTYTLGGVKTALAVSPYTETSGLVRQHSGGTKVVLSDTTAFWNTFANKTNDEVIDGNWTFTNFPATPASNPNASSTVKGISKLSIDPVSATDPIAVGDNDPRIATIPTIQTFLASGTWTKPANLRYVIVEVVGGGGGGGGADGAGSDNSNASGGGGGGYSRALILEGDLGGTETVTIGDGGTGGANTGADGTDGGDTLFGAHCTGNGGGKGYGDDTTPSIGGLPGTSSGGDLNIRGEWGKVCFPIGTTSAAGGDGGSSFYGIGAMGSTDGVNNSDASVVGLFGGGGGGAFSKAGAQHAGGDGAKGVCIVHEFY